MYTLDNFLKYPEVMPHLMAMLTHKSIHLDVASLHMTMLKKLIMDSLDSTDLPKRALKHHMNPEMQEINGNPPSEEDVEMTD